MACDFRLEVFITLCRTGSFTRTADALGISQPAVSQNIAELEKDLGAKLFTRSRGEVALTPDGMQFRTYADRILYWYESARSVFRPVGSSAGRVSVHCTADLSSAAVPGLFARLRRSFKDLSLSCSGPEPSRSSGDRGNSVSLYSAVRASSSVQAEPLPEGTVLLCSCSPVVAVSPLSRYLRESLVPGEDYGSWPVLAVWSSAAASELSAAGLSGRISFISDSPEAVKRLVSDDPAVAAVLPRYSVSDELSDGRLSELPSSWTAFLYDVYLHAPSSFRDIPIYDAIVRILREILAA